MAYRMNRRAFVGASAATAALAGTGALAQQPAPQPQTFLAGLVPSAPRPPATPAVPGAPAPARAAQTDADRAKSYFAAMDDAARLGVHNIEKTQPAVNFIDMYKGRESEFLAELNKRNLKLVGAINNFHPGRADLRATMVAENLRTARFVKAMGGKYTAALVAPIDSANGSVANNGTVKDFTNLDFKTVASNMDEMARTGFEETGIQLGYHPEFGDVSSGLMQYLMEGTQHLCMFADLGWMQEGGFDAVATAKKYYSRINGFHLRDYSPPKTPGASPIVPLGQGMMDVKGLIQFLREQKFTGCVMGEGSTNQLNYDYMHGTLGLTF